VPRLRRHERLAPVLHVRSARRVEAARVRRRRWRGRLLRRLLRLRALGPFGVTGERGEQLTRAEREHLEAELAELEGPKRRAVVEAISVARGHGDLSENFEYHAAKNEQGLLERRITILRSRLQNAEGIDEEAAAASGVVTVGSAVELGRGDGEGRENGMQDVCEVS